MERRPHSSHALAVFFGLFPYGPILTIGILNFQGPGGAG